MTVEPRIAIEPKLVSLGSFELVGIQLRLPAIELPAAVRVARSHLLQALSGIGVTPTELVGGGPCGALELPGSVQHEYTLGVDASTATLGGPFFKTVRIAAQRYAQFDYKGPMKDCWKVYVGAFDWSRDHRISFDKTAFYLERYPSDHDWDDRSTPENRVVIQLPIAG